LRNKRRDGERIRGLDGFHLILPYVMPKRTEAEVSLTEQFDVTELVRYMDRRNKEEGTNLKIFHAICTAVARTIYHRPKLNIFISGRTFYQRNDITLSFVVKQQFKDDGGESLMFMKVEPDMNFDSISKLIIGDVTKVRKEKTNDLDKLMDFFGSLPRPFLETFFGTLRVLEYHGIMPKSLTAGDPNYSSVLLSNLGSIKSDSCYHHLSNYGTCSVMITIGVLHKEQKLMDDGTWQERDVINCTFTIDERLADGFYFAKSLRIAKYMLEHPEVMNVPISKPVPVEL
jgi:pyruvate/2-oxoglutarate dehydrogenase complex dihydrolipoamide acyltransferase (E2) component